MLTILSIEARNFLSYGDIWTNVDLKKGLNLITGIDIQKKRSNGAGKTSFMEIIMFSLFGQVSKGLKQSQIINWKNKKSCETKTTFMKDNNIYTFHRGLKPNFLKVLKNEEEYPISSSVKEFQSDIENELIGMDFKTFNSLIYSNPNNSISILDTPKAQKRQFIEKQFNLTEFSELNKANNEYIKELDLLVHDIKKEQEYISSQLNDLDMEKLHNDLRALNKCYNDHLIKKEEFTNELLKISLVDDEKISFVDKLISDTKKSIEKLKDEEKQLEKVKNEVKSKLIMILSELKVLKEQKDKIGNITEHLEQYDITKNKLTKYEEIETILDEQKARLESAKKGLDDLKKNLYDHDAVIKEYTNKIKDFNISSLKNKIECPTCYQNIDYNSIKEKIDTKIDVFTGHINREKDNRQIIADGITTFENSIVEIKERIEDIEQKIITKQNLEKTLIKLEAYKEKQNELSIIDNKIKELSNYNSLKSEIDGYVLSIKKINDEIEELNSIVSYNESLYNEYQESIKRRNSINQKIELIDNDIKNDLTNIKFFEDQLKKQKDKELNLKRRNTELVKIYDEKIILKEHYHFIKDMLKDENIKQFAISNMVPIIEKQTNYYLSEAGFNFYLKLDSWLEAEIKGPGITDCSFASMSGGERKSIDLALKFAIMDISLSRNPNFPDILILDELLDSSVDSYGIHQLIEIIKVKQKKHNLKVFIISHRQEMDEIEPDNCYLITKKNGFSSVEIKK